MGWYRQRPIVVEAHKFDGTIESAYALKEWSGLRAIPLFDQTTGMFAHQLLLRQNYGLQTIRTGDYLLRESPDTYRICRDCMFTMTHELIDNERTESNE